MQHHLLLRPATLSFDQPSLTWAEDLMRRECDFVNMVVLDEDVMDYQLQTRYALAYKLWVIECVNQLIQCSASTHPVRSFPCLSMLTPDHGAHSQYRKAINDVANICPLSKQNWSDRLHAFSPLQN
jgi:hypothetical protein